MNKIQTIIYSLIIFDLIFQRCFGCGTYSYGEVECSVIGIDLGTTNTYVGAYRQSQIEIISNEFGNKNTQTIVAFTDDEILFGETAKKQEINNPMRTIYDIKRLIGRKYTDKSLINEKKLLPYQIVDKYNKPHIKIDNFKGKTKVYEPEVIQAMLLKKLKENAEISLGRKVKTAVLTIPAYFDADQRQITRDAATIAGLKVWLVLNEPTAAAIGFGLDKQGEKNILVYNLGGGTFDVTVMNFDGDLFEISSYFGDYHLGGNVFNNRVMDYFIKLIKIQHNRDISHDKKAMEKLKRQIEISKIKLSSSQTDKFEIKDLVDGFDFKEELTREKFEELNDDLFQKTFIHIQSALDESNLSKNQIDEILLVGGSTYIPKIRNLIQEYFGKQPNTSTNPQEASAKGATIQGDINCKNSFSKMRDIERETYSFDLEMIETFQDYQAKVSKEKLRIYSKYRLDNCVIEIKKQLEIYQQKKVFEHDIKIINDYLKEIQDWIVTNPKATLKEYDERKVNLESIWNPIIRKIEKQNEITSYSHIEDENKDL